MSRHSKRLIGACTFMHHARPGAIRIVKSTVHYQMNLHDSVLIASSAIPTSNSSPLQWPVGTRLQLRSYPQISKKSWMPLVTTFSLRLLRKIPLDID